MAALRKAYPTPYLAKLALSEPTRRQARQCRPVIDADHLDFRSFLGALQDALAAAKKAMLYREALKNERPYFPMGSALEKLDHVFTMKICDLRKMLEDAGFFSPPPTIRANAKYGKPCIAADALQDLATLWDRWAHHYGKLMECSPGNPPGLAKFRLSAASDFEQALLQALEYTTELVQGAIPDRLANEKKSVKRGAPTRNKERNKWIVSQRRKRKTYQNILEELQVKCQQKGWEPVSSPQAIQSICVKNG
ncbi:MAG TPA: hypothetical protein VKE98_09450 [Gemmataceae bacterium]|nr:hypothetical protein [Gemmataceae bacterium]